VPYQLHCDVLAHTEEIELLDELATELFELDETTLLELTTELFELEEELGTLLGTELEDATELLLVAEHTAPVMVGFSAAAVLFLSPCTPKLTDWPG
jgi:hypothetical protein